MANSNVPPVGETGEPESVLSGHTMEWARGGAAPLVTFLAAAAAAGVTGVAKEANADQQCNPVPFSIQSGASSVNGTVTPQGNGTLRVDARFSERSDRSYGMTVNPGDQCTNQAGIDVTVGNHRGPHLNACTCESGLCLFHTPRDAQGRRVRGGGHTEMPVPRCVETPSAPAGAPEQPAGPGVPASGGPTGAPSSSVAVPSVVSPATPRAPDPAEIFADLPEGFRVEARYELSSDRRTRVGNPDSLLSPRAAFRRGDLRTLQFDLDQLPAPKGMDLNNFFVAPDGSNRLDSGLYVFVGKSSREAGVGAPYEAVYMAHVQSSPDPQYLHFSRMYPPLGSDVGSGGPATMDFEGLVTINQEGDLSARPHVSSNDGLRDCDAIRGPDEGTYGNFPGSIVCYVQNAVGRAYYVGAGMLGSENMTLPGTVQDLREGRRMVLDVDVATGQVRAIRDFNPQAEGIESNRVQLPLHRMRSRGTAPSPGLRALIDRAVQEFMRRPLNASSSASQTPASGTGPALRPLPSAPPLAPPVNAAPAPTSMAVPPAWMHRVRSRA